MPARRPRNRRRSQPRRRPSISSPRCARVRARRDTVRDRPEATVVADTPTAQAAAQPTDDEQAIANSLMWLTRPCRSDEGGRGHAGRGSRHQRGCARAAARRGGRSEIGAPDASVPGVSVDDDRGGDALGTTQFAVGRSVGRRSRRNDRRGRRDGAAAADAHIFNAERSTRLRPDACRRRLWRQRSQSAAAANAVAEQTAAASPASSAGHNQPHEQRRRGERRAQRRRLAVRWSMAARRVPRSTPAQTALRSTSTSPVRRRARPVPADAAAQATPASGCRRRTQGFGRHSSGRRPAARTRSVGAGRRVRRCAGRRIAACGRPRIDDKGWTRIRRASCRGIDAAPGRSDAERGRVSGADGDARRWRSQHGRERRRCGTGAKPVGGPRHRPPEPDRPGHPPAVGRRRRRRAHHACSPSISASCRSRSASTTAP